MDNDPMKIGMDGPMDFLHPDTGTATLEDIKKHIDIGDIIPAPEVEVSTFFGTDAWFGKPEMFHHEDFDSREIEKKPVIEMTLEPQLEFDTREEDIVEKKPTVKHEHIQLVTSPVALAPATPNPALIRINIINKDVLMAAAKAAGINPAKLQVDEKLLGKTRQKRAPRKRIPDDQRTPEYWAKRAKNTEAAKRSRDLRRVKENELFLQVAYLEERYEKLQKEYAEMLELKARRLQLQANKQE